MAAPRKEELLKEIKGILSERSNFVLMTYSGLNVEQMSAVRREVRAGKGLVKVVKNNLFRRALQESPEHAGALAGLDAQLHGPLAVTFTANDMPTISKLVLKYSKEIESVQIKGGCLDGRFLAKAEVTEIATLPSKEELLAVIGRGLNTPAQKIATGMNAIIAGLARGIKAIGEKNG